METVRADDSVRSVWGRTPPAKPVPVSVYADLMAADAAHWLGSVAGQAIARGEDFQIQVQVASGPSAGRWVELRGRAERERPWIINGVSFDIKRHRQVAERVRASEARLHLLVERLPQAQASGM